MLLTGKLKLNIEYVQNQMKLPKNRTLDLVFKRAANNTYAVGAKYGNRWLQNLFGDGMKFADDIKKDELVDVMKALINAIESGEADDSIKAIQLRNIEAHSKAA